MAGSCSGLGCHGCEAVGGRFVSGQALQVFKLRYSSEHASISLPFSLFHFLFLFFFLFLPFPFLSHFHFVLSRTFAAGIWSRIVVAKYRLLGIDLYGLLRKEHHLSSKPLATPRSALRLGFPIYEVREPSTLRLRSSRKKGTDFMRVQHHADLPAPSFGVVSRSGSNTVARCGAEIFHGQESSPFGAHGIKKVCNHILEPY